MYRWWLVVVLAAGAAAAGTRLPRTSQPAPSPAPSSATRLPQRNFTISSRSSVRNRLVQISVNYFRKTLSSHLINEINGINSSIKRQRTREGLSNICTYFVSVYFVRIVICKCVIATLSSSLIRITGISWNLLQRSSLLQFIYVIQISIKVIFWENLSIMNISKHLFWRLLTHYRSLGKSDLTYILKAIWKLIFIAS